LTVTTRRGLLLAAGILSAWLGSLVILLPTTRMDLPVGILFLAVLGRTLLQTGLFIVAHDAMHTTLWPERPRVNRLIGQTALLLYGALPYRKCLNNHRRHHRHAGTVRDPDHHGEGDPSLMSWYLRFMAAYLSPWQLTALVVSWLVLASVAAPFSSSPLCNVLIYGALPVLMSSLQLFVVGTYLPHRPSSPGASDPAGELQPQSLNLPTWLSLLACFHFGYHWEHHRFPHLAWHELPAAKWRLKEGAHT